MCENKVNVCFNRTCSLQGRCYADGTIPKCRCFKFFSGEDCEIQSSEVKVMKTQSKTFSSIAIIIVVGIYFTIFTMDYFKYLHAAVIKKLFS